MACSMSDSKRTLVRAVLAVYPDKRKIVEQRKREGRRIWNHPEFIWEQLLRSFSTMGNSRGKRLMDEPELHDQVTFCVLAGMGPKARHARLRATLSAALVRMAERKADWLCQNFLRIQQDGGLDKVKATVCACKGRDAKIAFLLTFDGIGPKYARNILMDAYHPEFRDSIAYDDRLKKIADALGMKFAKYEDAERFFLDVAGRVGLNGWELDRLLYNAKEAIVSQIANDRHAVVLRANDRFRGRPRRSCG